MDSLSRLGIVNRRWAIAIDELAEWAANGEAFLSGTAAVLAPVGTILVDGAELTVGDGQPGANTMKLRQALVDIAGGQAADPHGWRTPIAS
ncbi:MAG: hypothetical protein P8N02_14465 [Actinomycetota bacterium]|nr:hypothetical protein [Actinomycetota bacterium]